MEKKYKKSNVARYCELVTLINEKTNHLEVMAGNFYDGGHSFEEINKITIDELRTLEREMAGLLNRMVNGNMREKM